MNFYYANETNRLSANAFQCDSVFPSQEIGLEPIEVEADLGLEAFPVVIIETDGVYSARLKDPDTDPASWFINPADFYYTCYANESDILTEGVYQCVDVLRVGVAPKKEYDYQVGWYQSIGGVPNHVIILKDLNPDTGKFLYSAREKVPSDDIALAKKNAVVTITAQYKAFVALGAPMSFNAEIKMRVSLETTGDLTAYLKGVNKGKPYPLMLRDVNGKDWYATKQEINAAIDDTEEFGTDNWFLLSDKCGRVNSEECDTIEKINLIIAEGF